MKPNPLPNDSGGSGRFQTTRWSLILSSLESDSPSAKANEALSHLCRIYWRPIFAFVSRLGYSVEDAQDLTQDFFVKVLRGDFLQKADPERGRFRSLLLKALQNFLADAREKRSALKRGGEIDFISWDDWMAEAPSQLSIPASALNNWSPERIYDVRWAATVVERALSRLAEECEAHGRRRVFDSLGPHLTMGSSDISYGKIAGELGIKDEAVARLLHQMRRRYRQLLRAEVAETISDPAETDEELRYLCAVLAQEAA